MGLVQRQNGQYIQADFFDNSAGLNTTDSPFRVLPNQAVSGFNYDYLAVGGMRKRYGHTLLNSTPDAQLRTLGFGLFNTSAGVKTLLRAAGTKLQSVNTTTGVCTSISDDTVSAGTTPFSSTQSVVFSQLNTASGNTTWLTGGGYANGILGYNGTSYTANGAVAPTSSGLAFGSALTTGGSLPGNQTYFYALALVKASTGAVSNASCDATYVVPAGTNTNRITLTFNLTGLDTTLYSQIRVYRSNTSGVSGFTVGDLIATVSSSTTTYQDTGATQGTQSAVPRAGNVNLDNSTLPSGTYQVLTTFKRRLVTAQGSTLYFSDVNKPESWPTGNSFPVPSGGNITALGIISFSTPTTAATDEFLVVFKERELWVVTGSSASDWSLKFNDYVGCLSQAMLVFANGFLFWIDYRGVYLWDGSNKPVYISRPVEYDFGALGDIDRSKLTEACGSFFRKQNEIVWFLSSVTLGEQVLGLKLDLRLTLPSMDSGISGRSMEGVFIKDLLTYPHFSCLATLPNYDETFYAGDASGNIYKLFDNANTDGASAAINFKYRTRPEDCGLIGTTKRFHKVIVWCRQSTVNNLTLNYWVNYKIDTVHQATQVVKISDLVTNGVWDQAYWDSGSYWDQNLVTYTPVVFNLSNASVGVEGEALTLEFQQADASAPLTIAGYSILYTAEGTRM